MKNIGHSALTAILALTLSSAFAGWEYVETSGTTYNKGGSGYLKDGNSSWQMPVTRAPKTYNLTVDFSQTAVWPIVSADTPVSWDFASVKTTTVKDQPESDCFVVNFKYCGGINISELIAPHCTQISAHSCFSECDFLKKVHLPECSSLSYSTFAECDLLESVYMPKLASVHNSGGTFSGCTGLKSFEWNMQGLTKVPSSCFAGCSSLARVDIKTPVITISGNAFKDIAPAAELYMPAAAPETIGENAFSNTKDCVSPKGPVQRIYLQDNFDEWLEIFRKNHHIIKLSNAQELAAFNAGWEEPVSATKTRTRSHVIDQMVRDPDICSIDAEDGDRVTILKRNLLAYAVRRHDGTVSYSYGCWIFKVPKTGFQIIVR